MNAWQTTKITRRQLNAWRARVLLAIIVCGAVLLGWLAGVGWWWDAVTEPLVIARPVFIRQAPAGCVLDGWAIGEREDVPAGAVTALVMTDPMRSSGWAACWPLWGRWAEEGR